MCSANAPTPRRWDGTSVRFPRSRSLRVDADSPTRLARAAQSGRCPDCGNRVDWHPRTDSDGRRVGLHPQELPAAAVPAISRWHVSSGIAHPAHDGTPWCRIPHTALCPARSAPAALTPQLTTLRRHLTLHTRRLINNGTLTTPAAPPSERTESCRPARPIAHLLGVHYIADRPIGAIQCVAQTRQRRRCTRPVLDDQAPHGTWTLAPATLVNHRSRPGETMAVYDLTHLAFAEQMRWRHQHCPGHAASSAADLALTEWEPFDARLHHQHMHQRLPHGGRKQHHGA
ncbi:MULTISPECIES: DUF6083 domain-containing protein [unclassified Streptomyces]|uniref:DUF6083 domain-containing protein n=1 Tax=unclassified Streptomyces TaxID=2593676 RepID=UPI000B511A02|nr:MULTISPECIES: DUF6083 domain-containing protein [unclassified Streptomyces]MYW98912.1 hypothetical protein [Streptomyces sp. SID8378]SNB90923.1 hypothetical protein SAMN02745831_07240 [Streptomyces sp. PgraA7]